MDDKYTVEPECTKRVKTVVDTCLSKGLYVFLNTNQLIHTVIRTSGGNNDKKYTLFTFCAAANGYWALNGFQLPEDS